jgi:hypothetical protein
VDVFIEANDAGAAGDKSPINVSSAAQPSTP